MKAFYTSAREKNRTIPFLSQKQQQKKHNTNTQKREASLQYGFQNRTVYIDILKGYMFLQKK